MEGPSRRERNERRDSDVHGAGVYWRIGVFKFVGGRLYCGDAGATPPRYGTGGYRGFLVMSVRSPYGSVCPQGLGFYSFHIYIYISLM